MRASSVFLMTVVLAGARCGGGASSTPPPAGHVIEIDVDDHGLAGLWMANAPNLKGLIARGTLAYSRVIVPTHSNQSNIALLTGQYPEANNVPHNVWLSREQGFVPPVSLPGLMLGDYARYDRNPLLTRGDSVYRAVARRGLRSGYFGQLPPFEAGADDVHLSIVGAQFAGLDITADLARTLLTGVLLYPKPVIDGYVFAGPPASGESLARFTLRDAADFVRATSAAAPMPAFMFVWDFIALDNDPTSVSGANGADLVKIIEDYDAGLGDLLGALTEKGLLADTNILFTLDHGKVDTHQQVALGTRGGGGSAAMPADGTLAAAVAARGPALGITVDDYALLNEDGDALIYARVAGAETAAGAARQAEVTRALLTIIQSGEIAGVDTTRTITGDGALGTRRFHDFRASTPNQPDIIVFPKDDWTLNQVDRTNAQPGPFREHTQYPYGRHGGFSEDELYVPLIMAGPAFKGGVVLPHPVAHPQVPATALWTLGQTRLETAQVPAISAALVGDPGEALPQPVPLDGARDLVLRGSGYGGVPALAGAPATAAVIIDVAGLSADALFTDGALAEAAAPIRELAARGTRFQDFWTRSRDWPVTEYEMLAGGYPVSDPWIPAAEDDPTQPFLPGAGLLQMPPAPRFVANQAGYDGWRQTVRFGDETLFEAAHALGLTTALVGQSDFHALHIDPAAVDERVEAADDEASDRLSALLVAHPRLLALVAVGGARPPHGRSELGAVARTVAKLADAAAGALVIVTSRGVTPIDDPAADPYGPGTSRHVPFIVLGPNVRPGVVSSQPAQPADLPATVLFGLGAPTRTDFVDGTWAAGTPVGGIPQPTPRHATAGHALLRAYNVTLGAGPVPLP